MQKIIIFLIVQSVCIAPVMAMQERTIAKDVQKDASQDARKERANDAKAAAFIRAAPSHRATVAGLPPMRASLLVRHQNNSHSSIEREPLLASSSSSSSSNGHTVQKSVLKKRNTLIDKRRQTLAKISVEKQPNPEQFLGSILDSSNGVAPQNRVAVDDLYSYIGGEKADDNKENVASQTYTIYKQARASARIETDAQRQSLRQSYRKSKKILEQASPADANFAKNMASLSETDRVVIRQKESKHKKKDRAKNLFLHDAQLEKHGELQKIIDSGLIKISRARNWYGDTALALAVRENKIETVRYLLAQNINVMTYNLRGATPLDIATELSTQRPPPRGIHDIIWELRHTGGAQESNSAVKSALYELVQKKPAPLDEIRQMLTYCSANMVDGSGNSLLALAARAGSLEAILLLMKKKYHTAINTINRDNQTPLDLAKPHDGLHSYLRERGALSYQEVLHQDEVIACVQKGSFEAARALLERLNKSYSPADFMRILNAPDDAGNTALHHAVEKENMACVELLALTYHVAVNEINAGGMRPLDIAIAHNIAIPGKNKNNTVEAIRDLLRTRCNALRYFFDIESNTSTDERNLLEYARVGAYDKLYHLYNNPVSSDATRNNPPKRIDPNNITDAQGNSPLALAAMRNDADMVNFLLQKGADPNAVNDQSLSVVDIVLNNAEHAPDLKTQKALDKIYGLLCSRGAMTQQELCLKNLLLDYIRSSKIYDVAEIRRVIPDWGKKANDDDNEHPATATKEDLDPHSLVTFGELLQYLQLQHQMQPAVFPNFLTIKDGRGYSLLAVAAESDHEEYVHLLLETFNMNPNTQDNEFKTPLDRALNENIEKMLEAKNGLTGAQVLVLLELLGCSFTGNIPRFSQVIAEIRQAGLRVEKFLYTPDAQGQVPLILAARAGRLEMIKYLVKELHVDLAHHGHKAFAEAVANGHDNVAVWLKDHMKGLVDPKSNGAAKEKKHPNGHAHSNGHPGNGSVAEKNTAKANGKKVTEKDASKTKLPSKESVDPALFLDAARKADEKELLKLCSQVIKSRDDENIRDFLDATLDAKKHTPLALVVLASGAKNQLFCAQLLLGHGANPNTLNANGASPYDHADYTMNEQMQALLKRHNAKRGTTIRAFDRACAAIKDNSLEQLQSELSHCDNPQERQDMCEMNDSDGNNLVTLAVELGYESIVCWLIENFNFSPNAKNKKGDSLITLAARAGHVPVLRYLAELKKVPADKEALFLTAIEHGRRGVLQYFIDSKQITDLLAIRKIQGQSITYIDWAAQHKQQGIVGYLRSLGALPVSLLPIRQGILNGAKNHSPHELKTNLDFWQFKAQWDAGPLKDDQGNTPLHLAVMTSNGQNWKETVELLVERTDVKTDGRTLKYFDIEAVNNANKTVLDLANDAKNYRLVAFLQEHGAKPYEELEPQDKKAERLKRETEVTERRRRLCDCASANKFQELRELLKNSSPADRNAQNNQKNSLLALAVLGGNLPMVVMLVEEFRVTLNTKNRDGKTPLDLADLLSDKKIKQYLDKAGALYGDQMAT